MIEKMFLSVLSKTLLTVWILTGILRAVFFYAMIQNRKPTLKWSYWRFYTTPSPKKTLFTEKGLHFRKAANALFLLFSAISIALAISLIYY